MAASFRRKGLGNREAERLHKQTSLPNMRFRRVDLLAAIRSKLERKRLGAHGPGAHIAAVPAQVPCNRAWNSITCHVGDALHDFVQLTVAARRCARLGAKLDLVASHRCATFRHVSKANRAAERLITKLSPNINQAIARV
jgi:ribosomal protein L34E